MISIPEKPKNPHMVHYQKINIFGDPGVGKSTLIECMANYNNENYAPKIDTENENNSFVNSNTLIEQVKKINYKIDDDTEVYYNIYETNINRYDTIKNNLDTLLLQTECVIIMWSNGDFETFSNASNFAKTIFSGIQKKLYDNVPIFFVQNKTDLELNKSEVSNPDNDITKFQNENSKLIFKQISLKDKDSFMDLLLNMKVSIENNKEKFNKDDPRNLIKINKDLGKRVHKKEEKLAQINIALLGHVSTGKSSFINYLIKNDNDIIPPPTTSLATNIFDAEIENKDYLINIDDTAGQERFNSLLETPIKRGHGFLIFYDICSEDSFDYVDKYIERINHSNASKEIIILGNKLDEIGERKITIQKVKDYAKEKDFKYYECSCKDGTNINEIFNEIISMAYYRYKQTQIQRVGSNLNNVSIERDGPKDENKSFCCNLFR